MGLRFRDKVSFCGVVVFLPQGARDVWMERVRGFRVRSLLVILSPAASSELLTYGEEGPSWYALLGLY